MWFVCTGPSCALVSTFHTFAREPALSLTSKVNLQGIRVPFQGITSVKHQRSSKSYTMAATAGLDLEVFGKGKPGSGSPSKERGDCEFICFTFFIFPYYRDGRLRFYLVVPTWRWMFTTIYCIYISLYICVWVCMCECVVIQHNI